MNRDMINEALNIRYIDLKFTLAMQDDVKLPRYKCSALRGGMGQMLLQQNCIRNQDCEHCDFVRECIVQRTLYSQFEIQPKFASRGDSIGYVIECDNHKEYFRRGEKLSFHLLIFGKTIVYFTQFFQAFFMLGQQGLGKEKAKYEIVLVESENGGLVANAYQICIQNLGIRTVREYVEERKTELLKHVLNNIIKFNSPVTLKYQGEFIRNFQGEAFVRSVIRRIYCFDCFEGIDIPLMEIDEEIPRIVQQKSRHVSVPRYSSTKGKMELKGIQGEFEFEKLSEEMLMLFLAGEKLHIGKNSSFGFGKYIIY